MKKALVTTRVENYRPELCAYTMPNLKRYADAVGADFIEITERQFPKFHPAYEKLQVHEIARHYDKTLLVDADMIIHPRLPSLIDSIPVDTVALWQQYAIKHSSLTLWETAGDPYFMRDGRNLGVVGCLVGCTRSTYDVFEPLPDTCESVQMQDKIYRPAIIDEYTMSRNVARYGLKISYPWFSQASIGVYHADATTKNDADILDNARRLLKVWE